MREGVNGMKSNKMYRALATILAMLLLVGSVPVVAWGGESDTPDAEDTRAYEAFLADLLCLEGYAQEYARTHTGEDATALVLNYIRCGIESYTDSSWTMMAGAEKTEFTVYVTQRDMAMGTTAAALRDLTTLRIPNGQTVDLAHMFGCLDISYASRNSQVMAANADLGGWGGDICDLICYTQGRVSGSVEQMAEEIRTATEDGHPKYLGYDDPSEEVHSFGILDLYGDLDAYYVYQGLLEGKTVSTVLEHYYTENLTDAARARFFATNRFAGAGRRNELRAAVLEAYRNSTPIAALEASRGLTDVDDLRRACCYAFADYLYELTGDMTDRPSSEYYSVYASETTTLAPGVTQTLRSATLSDGKTVNYYVAVADVTRDDVQVAANYRNNTGAEWGFARVQDQMTAAAERHSDPSVPELYIQNYTPIVGINADYYTMDSGQPRGALAMEGVIYQEPVSGTFFAILEDGTPLIATASQWESYRDDIREAVGGGGFLLRNGVQMVDSEVSTSRDSHTCVGITADHRVVFVVVDGRQEPVSAGASLADMAQIMREAGCVTAIELDGGGSSTYVARSAGTEEPAVINRPSDGYARSVSSSLMIVSTARPVQEFDHAVISTDYDILTVGTSLALTLTGVSVSGGTAELPEGATVRVSDETRASLAGTTLTALSAGSVQVQLVAADGQTVLGSKTLTVVLPDELELHFESASVNAVYGISVELPLIATWQGAPVAFNSEDVTLGCLVDGKPCEPGWGGILEGLTFTGDESTGIRQVIIGAALAGDEGTLTDAVSVTVFLYRADEAMFDPEKRTGGDAVLGWIRDVSNAQTQDGQTYYPEREGSSMDISYTFAVDMTQIPIPERVSPLMQYIAGSDRGMSAWDTLLQLAERVHPRTEVVLTLTFSEGVTPDTSELLLVNEYFEMTDVTWDDATSTLTVRCHFIKQSAPIDPSTANPLCVLSGLRLIPDEDAAEQTLSCSVTGTLSYSVYLRINAAHTMAQNPEFQEKYGIYPYQDEVYGNGAYFSEDELRHITDRFTLDKTTMSGWISQNGSWYYYVNGQPLTGIRQLVSHIEGEEGRYYYDLGDDGAVQDKLSGLFEMGGKLYLAENGIQVSGWKTVSIAGDSAAIAYFSPSDYAAVDGEQLIAGYRYTFRDRVLVRGDLIRYTDGGTRYRWAGTWCSQSWMTVDGNTYYFGSDYYAKTGFYSQNENGENVTYAFDENGIWLENLTGLFEWNGEIYWVEQGIKNGSPGLRCVDGDYYYFHASTGGTMARGETCWVETPNGLMAQGTYSFDEEGRMIDPRPYRGLITWLDEDGTVLLSQTYNYGTLPEYPDELADKREETRYYYRFVGWDHEVETVLGDVTYQAVFAMVGKNGLSVESDGIYWLVDGVPNANGIRPARDEAGHTIYYCFVDGRSIVHTTENESDFWAAENEGCLPVWGYYTDENGVVLHSENFENGIVREGDKLYYYINGVRAHMGMFLHTDGYYYYARGNGELLVDCEYYCECMDSGMANSAGDTFSVGLYSFDSQGHLILPKEGILEEDGSLYYYVKGVRTYAGLIELDGYMYYVRSNGEVVHGVSYWITKTNGLMREDNYTFDENGRMLSPSEENVGKYGIVRDDDGVLRYYVNGFLFFGGLIRREGHLYYATGDGTVICNGSIWTAKTNGLLPEGWYSFDENGCLIDPPEPDMTRDGIVRDEDGYAYYANGYRTYEGLIRIGGSYYYASTDGMLVCGCSYWVSKTNGLLPEGLYRFDETGCLTFS